MKPTWGLVAALALLTASLYGMTAAGKAYLSGAQPRKTLTAEQFEAEKKLWHIDDAGSR